MQSEFYFDPERGTVVVDVTDTYGAELRKALAEVGEGYEWTSAEFKTVRDGDEVLQMMLLHGARERVSV